MTCIVTCDLVHESECSYGVSFILVLSDPDVELVSLIPAVIIEKLQALNMAVSVGGHLLTHQSA